MKQFLRSFLTLLMLVVWASGFAQSSLSVDFESDLTTYTDWTFKNIAQSATITPHSGTYYGDTSGRPTAYVQTKNKIEAPQQLTFYISKVSNNTTTSNWRIQVSTDGKTWNNVKSVSATSMDRGQWFEVTQNLEKYKNNYVRVYYDGGRSTATRCIDDITLTLGSSKTPTTLTFPQSTISIEEGNEATFTGQKATLKTDKTELDKAITYAYSGSEIFATFNTATGDATLKTGVYGTATVTATYAGDDTYEKAVASYTVTVKNPNVLESTTTYDFVNNKYGYNRGEDLKDGDIISNKTSITIVNTKNSGSTKTRFWDNDLRNYQDAILTINAKEGCLINKITITGTRIDQLNLNGKNGTWDNGVWTGSASSVSFTNPGGKKNGVYFETITIEYTAPAPLTLEEDADDTDTKIEKNNGKTVDVKLTRSLKAGVWNTICLPFDVTAEQVESVLKATDNVKEFDKEDKATATIFFKPATEMKAGVPYLIKPTEDAKVLNFKDVTINNVDELSRINGNDYCICGVFGKYTMKTNGTELFLNAAGKFVAPAAATNTMKGFRAYFNVPLNVSAAALNINIDGETTGINSIETNATVNGKVYNLNGQYVGNSLNGLKKGIYVVNGKKVIK